MVRIFWLYLALVVAGLIILAWPEENDLMLIQFSDTHGPSSLDLVGILIIMFGYVPMAIEIGKRFTHLMRKLGKWITFSLIILSSIALAIIAWGLYSENDLALWLSVLMSTTTQGLLIYHAFRV